MIDMTINLNEEMIDLDLLVLEPTYYLMATLIYNYSKYIRRIKWPSNYVDLDKQQDCYHSSIGSIMMDLIENRVTISQVYKWIESIELKFSEGKKIWFHFNLKLDSKFIGDTEELRSITIPLVFCRGHESITCCVFIL